MELELMLKTTLPISWPKQKKQGLLLKFLFLKLEETDLMESSLETLTTGLRKKICIHNSSTKSNRLGSTVNTDPWKLSTPWRNGRMKKEWKSFGKNTWDKKQTGEILLETKWTPEESGSENSLDTTFIRMNSTNGLLDQFSTTRKFTSELPRWDNLKLTTSSVTTTTKKTTITLKDSTTSRENSNQLMTKLLQLVKVTIGDKESMHLLRMT